MVTIRIVLAILSFIGMFFLARELDKNETINTSFNALCVGGIATLGIILGLCLGLLLA